MFVYPFISWLDGHLCCFHLLDVMNYLASWMAYSSQHSQFNFPKEQLSVMSPLWWKVVMDFTLPLRHRLGFPVRKCLVWSGHLCWEGMVGNCALWSIEPSHMDGAFCQLSFSTSQSSHVSSAHLVLSMCCCTIGREMHLYVSQFPLLDREPLEVREQGWHIIRIMSGLIRAVILFDALYVPGPLLGPFFC